MEALRCDADGLERVRGRIGDSPMRRLCDFIPEHRFGAGFPGQFGDNPGRGPFAQHQRPAE